MRPKAAIDDAVAAVGDKWLAGRRLAQPGTGAEHLQRRPGCFQPEGDDLYRNRCVRPQSIDQLRPVDDDGEAAAGRRDDFLVQQRSAQPFDQVERAALHLVGAVDREIDLAMLGEGGERNTGGCRLRRRALVRLECRRNAALDGGAGRAPRPRKPAVEPVPSPTTISCSTNWTAASAAARLRASRSAIGYGIWRVHDFAAAAVAAARMAAMAFA